MKTVDYHEFVLHAIVGGFIWFLTISIKTKIWEIDDGLEVNTSTKYQIFLLCLCSIYLQY